MTDQPYQPKPLPKLPCILIEAIAREEGYYAQQPQANGTWARPQRNCNPGNIVYGKFALHHGATGRDGEFAVFPDAKTGFAALRALLAGPSYCKKTIAEAIAPYAPPSQNDTALYITRVCLWTGLKETDIVGEHV